MAYYSFVFLGFINLIPWNVILSSLDFFEENLEKYDPTYYFPLFYTFFSVLVQILLLIGKRRLTYLKKKIGSLVLCSFIMILLPVIAIFIFGFECYLICSILVVCLGISNAIFQSSVLGICSFLPAKFIIALSYGSGFSGVIINFFRFIFFFTFYEEYQNLDINIKQRNIYYFFTFSVLLLICSAILVIFIFKNAWFIHNLAKGGNFDEYSSSLVNDIRVFYIFEDENDSDSLLDQSSVVNSIIKRYFSFLEEILYLLKRLYNLNFIVFSNYLITLIVIPAILFEMPLFSLIIPIKYYIALIIYNISDTIGKIFPILYKLPIKSMEKLILFRLFFIVFIGCILSSYKYNNGSHEITSYLGCVFNILFGFSNGYFTTLSFTYAPQLVDDSLKGKAGSFINLSLTFGIFVGSFHSTLIIQKLLK